jgi:hypothetical protein
MTGPEAPDLMLAVAEQWAENAEETFRPASEPG